MNEPLDLGKPSVGGDKKETVNSSTSTNPSPYGKSEPVFPEPKRLEVMVDVDEKPKDKPTTFDFLDNEKIEDTIANPTKGDEAKKTQTPPKNQEDLLSKLTSTSSSSSSANLDDGDFVENADFIIDGLCFLLTAGFRWYSMDTTDTPYEFKQPKIDKLKSQLARILKRKQKAFPAEWAFVGTLLACCITPATKANDNRKKVKEERAIEESRRAKLKEEGKEESPRKGRGRGQPSK